MEKAIFRFRKRKKGMMIWILIITFLLLFTVIIVPLARTLVMV